MVLSAGRVHLNGRRQLVRHANVRPASGASGVARAAGCPGPNPKYNRQIAVPERRHLVAVGKSKAWCHGLEPVFFAFELQSEEFE